MNQKKQIVCLASTMRSGSTLLKALLAEASDVSNLPEENFQKYVKSEDPQPDIEKLDERNIILLKRPAWYNETKTYPQLPAVDDLKVIVLIRDVYDTVQSCRKMTFHAAEKIASAIADARLAKRYWLPITRSLLELHENDKFQTRLIRYEDLVADPIEQTRLLFEFLGSQQKQGVESYDKPEDFKWKWGRDDGSPNIRSLKVQPPRQKPQTNQRLLDIIDGTAEIIDIRQRLHYPVKVDPVA